MLRRRSNTPDLISEPVAIVTEATALPAWKITLLHCVENLKTLELVRSVGAPSHPIQSQPALRPECVPHETRIIHDRLCLRYTTVVNAHAPGLLLPFLLLSSQYLLLLLKMQKITFLRTSRGSASRIFYLFLRYCTLMLNYVNKRPVTLTNWFWTSSWWRRCGCIERVMRRTSLNWLLWTTASHPFFVSDLGVAEYNFIVSVERNLPSGSSLHKTFHTFYNKTSTIQ